MVAEFAGLPDRFEYESERLVYEHLKEACPDDWIILPSVKFQPPKENQRQIDFVLLVPESPGVHKGAVICLEVKGGNYDIDKKGNWYGFAGGNRQRMNSPIDDTKNKVDRLRNWLQKRLKDDPPDSAINLKKFGFDYAVVFPDFEPDDPDTLRVYDKSDLAAGRVVQGLISLVKDVGCREDSGKSIRFRSLDPLLAKILRDRMIPRGKRQIYVRHSDIESKDRELANLTEEQYFNLSLVQDADGNLRNRRVLFEGGAGTGKTMLAMELARRRKAAGDRVAFIVTTFATAAWAHECLKNEIELIGPLVNVLFYGCPELLDLKKRYIEAKDNPEIEARLDLPWLNDTLEHYALEATEIMSQRDLKWDYLIVDELQYFQLKSVVSILGLSLRGGLSAGNWAMFGDFETQNLNTNYNLMLESSDQELTLDLNALVDAKQSLLGDIGGVEGEQIFTRAPELTVNCRNSFPIASAAARVVGNPLAADLDPDNQLMKVSGVDPRIRFWTDQAELGGLLAEEFKLLSDNGVSPKYVKVVYDRYLDVFRELNDIDVKSGLWHLRFMDEDETRRLKKVTNPVRAYPIYDFAGLESEVIILIVDEMIEGVSKENEHCIRYYSQLFYVGISRAKTGLVILSHESHADLIGRIV